MPKTTTYQFERRVKSTALKADEVKLFDFTVRSDDRMQLAYPANNASIAQRLYDVLSDYDYRLQMLIGHWFTDEMLPSEALDHINLDTSEMITSAFREMATPDNKELKSVSFGVSSAGNVEAQIVGQWYNRKKRLVGVRVDVTIDEYDAYTFDFAIDGKGHIAAKSYGVVSAYQLVKRNGLSDYANALAQVRTKEVNTVGVRHTVRFKLVSGDIGEVV